MSGQPDATLERLARANPVPPDGARVQGARAQADLARIVATPRPAHPRRRARRSRRFTGLALAAALVAAGGAFAATDPFGLWASHTPGTALYGVDPSRHARTLSIPEIECGRAGAGALRCGAHAGGLRYRLVDAIRPPSALTRPKLVAALRQSARSHAISAEQLRRIGSDLAQVSDGFLARMSVMLRFGS